MNAHEPKHLSTNRSTRIQTFKSKALPWKETPSLSHTCLLTLSCSTWGSAIFIHHPQCFNTAIVSRLHLHFAKANEVCLKPVPQSSEHLCSTLSQFQLQLISFYLAWPGCTQSVMWSPIWHCPLALTFCCCLPFNIYFFKTIFPQPTYFFYLNFKLLEYNFLLVFKIHYLNFAVQSDYMYIPQVLGVMHLFLDYLLCLLCIDDT